jgi:apolipoprotein D and lipocalin family protein
MGTWYQVALYPNRFQKQCVSDTSASYRQRADGMVEVLNRCKDSAGKWDEAQGLGRPIGRLLDGRLSPAQLEVSFLPAWLRWLPVGWGSYWVLSLADDGRYAVVGEPTREYLWILSRTPQLRPEDDQRIRDFLLAHGYDLNRLESHRHTLP